MRRPVGVTVIGDALHVACDDGTGFWLQQAIPAYEGEDRSGRTYRVEAPPAKWVSTPPIPGSPAGDEDL